MLEHTYSDYMRRHERHGDENAKKRHDESDYNAVAAQFIRGVVVASNDSIQGNCYLKQAYKGGSLCPETTVHVTTRMPGRSGIRIRSPGLSGSMSSVYFCQSWP